MRKPNLGPRALSTCEEHRGGARKQRAPLTQKRLTPEVIHLIKNLLAAVLAQTAQPRAPQSPKWMRGGRGQSPANASAISSTQTPSPWRTTRFGRLRRRNLRLHLCNSSPANLRQEIDLPLRAANNPAHPKVALTIESRVSMKNGEEIALLDIKKRESPQSACLIAFAIFGDCSRSLFVHGGLRPRRRN